MATQATAGKSRGDGPVTFLYVDAQGQDHKRVPNNVKGVKVIDRATNSSKIYELSKYSQSVRDGLSAIGLVRRQHNYVVSNLGNGKDVHYLTDSVHGDFTEGRLYSKEAVARAAKTFDVSAYVNAYARYLKLQHEAKKVHPKTGKVVQMMDDKERERITTKWVAMGRKDFNTYAKAHLNSATMTKFIMEEKAKLLKGAKEDLADVIEV